MLRACESCARPVSIALLVVGILIMTAVVTLFGVFVYVGWTDGWPSGVIALVLFTTAPIVTFVAYNDYRTTEGTDSPRKRLTWLGVSLAILGALELCLVVAEIFLFIAMAPANTF